MRESDIRPADLFAEYLRLSVADVAAFFSDRSDFEPRPCPGCGASASGPAFDKFGFSFQRCQVCQTLYANPIPTAAQLDRFYRDSPSQGYWAQTFFPAVAEQRREKIFRPRVSRIRDLAAAHGTQTEMIIDVGAGSGIFLEECRALGFGSELVAIEPSQPLAEVCRKKGLTTVQGFAGDVSREARLGGRGSVVVSFEVIEHVPSPMNFLSSLAELTVPGGLIVTTGLCGTGFDIMTLGAGSKSVAPPHHLNFLSAAGARALVERCGLECVDFLTPGQLDVDIVRNALRENSRAVTDPFLLYLLQETEDSTRESFQKFLADNRLSSHMWIVARRPGTR